MSVGQDCIISEWLRSLGLQQYSSAFYDNGYDELELCKLIKDEDLDAIGVNNSLHRKILLDSVMTLKCEGATSVYFTLEEVSKVRAGSSTARQSPAASASSPPATRELIYDVSPRANSAFKQTHTGSSYSHTNFPSSAGITLPMSIADLVKSKLDMERVNLSLPPYTQVGFTQLFLLFLDYYYYYSTLC